MISIRRLQKRFHVSDGVVNAIKSLDLEIAEGELFVIVGASGSGKTTLLRCIAGLETPDGGEIRIAGKIVFHPTIHRRGYRRNNASSAWCFNPTPSGLTSPLSRTSLFLSPRAGKARCRSTNPRLPETN